jgi:hypothetical protein
VPGAPGSAVGYAHVLFSGGVASVASGKGVTSAMVTASPTLTGFVCFSNLPFTVHDVSATLDADSVNDVGIAAGLGSFSGFSCPAGTVAGVRTLAAVNSSADSDFWVTFN